MNDYQKLLMFAHLLGIKVTQGAHDRDNAAVFVYGEEPEIILHEQTLDDEWTFALLHEIGHALDWIKMGRPPESQIPGAFGKGKAKLSAEDRRLVYEFEKRAIENMELIWTMLGLEVEQWKLKAEQEMDMWVAQTFLDTGRFPTERSRKAKSTQLLKKHAP